MKHLIPILAACLLWGCSTQDKDSYILEGAWVLQQAKAPWGDVVSFSDKNNKALRLYSGDSVLYQCVLNQTGSAFIVKPNMLCDITVINKGNNEYIYLEEDDFRPFKILNDSTVIIQQHGYHYTWCRDNGIASEWGGFGTSFIIIFKMKPTEKYKIMCFLPKYASKLIPSIYLSTQPLRHHFHLVHRCQDCH